MPRRPCRKAGCRELTRDPSGYCEKHKKEATEQEREQYRRYDRQRQDEIEWQFYKSTAWKKVREAALARDNYLCQECMKEGKLTPATTVHHIVEVKADWDRRLDLDNLVTLCEYHHNKAHGR